MSTLVLDTDHLTPEQIIALGPMLREAMRDRTWEFTPLGEDVLAFLKRKPLADESKRSYEGILANLARYYPDVRVAHFAPPMGTELVERWLDAEWGHCSRSTRNHSLRIAASFFRHYVRRGTITASPTENIEAGRVPEPYRESFTREDYLALLAAANQRDRICLRLLFDLALRKGALRAIRFRHFDYSRRVLTVFTKGSTVRELPVVWAELWTDLERHVQDVRAERDHYLLCRVMGRWQTPFPSKPMGNNGAELWLKRRCADAGVEYKSMHKARHTALQDLYERTGDVKLVQELAGHSSLETTQRYLASGDIGRLAAAMRDR